MEKSLKKQVFVVVYAIALVLAVIGVIQLLCNGIELLNYTSLSPNSYGSFQKPHATILIIASCISMVGVIIDVIAPGKKNKVLKIVCYLLSLAILISMIVMIIMCTNIWAKYEGNNITNGIYEIWSGNANYYTIHSTVKSLLISQAVYFGIMLVLYIWDIFTFFRKNVSQPDEHFN